MAAATSSTPTPTRAPGPPEAAAPPSISAPEPEPLERCLPSGLVRSAILAVGATVAALVALELLPSRGALVLSAWILALAALGLQAVLTSARGPAPGQDGAGRSAASWRREHVPASPADEGLRRALGRLRREPPRPAPVPFASEVRLLANVLEGGAPGPHLQLHRLLGRLDAELHGPARRLAPGGGPSVAAGRARLDGATSGGRPAALSMGVPAGEAGAQATAEGAAEAGAQVAAEAALVDARTWWEAVPDRRNARDPALAPLDVATLDALLDLLEAGALGPSGPAAGAADASMRVAGEARGRVWSR